jgi:hypothetical protein
VRERVLLLNLTVSVPQTGSKQWAHRVGIALESPNCAAFCATAEISAAVSTANQPPPLQECRSPYLTVVHAIDLIFKVPPRSELDIENIQCT